MGIASSQGVAFEPATVPATPAVQSKLSTTFEIPAACKPCRTEDSFTLYLNGVKMVFTLRDRILPEDPYLVLLKAAAFSIARGEEYRGAPPDRTVKDFLVKHTVLPI